MHTLNTFVAGGEGRNGGKLREMNGGGGGERVTYEKDAVRTEISGDWKVTVTGAIGD